MSLKGNSGCQIERVGNDVIKSAEGSYVPRLQAQAIKQKGCSLVKWYDDSYIPIQAVPVKDIINSSNKLEIVMPYIDGVTLAEKIKDKTNNARLAKVLFNFINSNISFSNVIDARKIFEDKLNDMKNKNPNLTSELDNFSKNYLPYVTTIRGGWCHGDFTLENMLLVEDRNKYGDIKRNIYLIDFLDSFIDTPFMDAATVLQDCLCLWSYRYEELNKQELDAIKLFYSNFKLNFTDPYFVERKGWFKQVLVLLLLKIYRIIPYAKDDVTKDWCNVNIDLVKGEIEKCS